MTLYDLSKRMRKWNVMEFYNVRKVVDGWSDEVERLELIAKEADRMTNTMKISEGLHQALEEYEDACEEEP